MKPAVQMTPSFRTTATTKPRNHEEDILYKEPTQPRRHEGFLYKMSFSCFRVFVVAFVFDSEVSVTPCAF